MGRPQKTKVSETSAEVVVQVIDRVAKKLKSFSRESLLAAVVKSFQKTEDVAELGTLEAVVVSTLLTYTSNGKYTVANGVFSAVQSKRGRPRKVVEAVAAAV